MNKNIQKILIILIYIGLILINTKVYAVQTGKATSETTRIRKEASTDSDIIALISLDEEVEIIGEEGDWYKVTYVSSEKTYTGYIRKDILSVEGNEESSTSKTSESDETTSQNETAQEQVDNSQENQTTVVDEQVEKETQEQSNEESLMQAGYTGVLSAKIDIKILPSINSSIISEIEKNTSFTVIEIINKWCYIETQNSSGWVLLSKIESEKTESVEETQEQEQNQDEIEEEEQEEQEVKTVTKYVSAETLNLRATTETDSTIIAQLSLNTEVTVLEEVDSTWTKIQANGKTGYVASKYLSDTKTEMSSRSEEVSRTENVASIAQSTETTSIESTSTTECTEGTESSDSLGDSIVAFAKQYLGYKYVSGGSSPSTGFDCSGFTTYVYKNFGISLSRTSTGQASCGVAVAKSALQPGDLVIFNNSSNTSIGHVGIYIGGNTFIHAANASKGVITTSLSESYYLSRYVTGRRVL